MKKTLALAAAMLFAVQLVNAQTQKGSVNLGFDLNHYASKMDGAGGQGSSWYTQYHKIENLTVGPTIGYFVCDGLELGAGIFYQSSLQNQAQNSVNGYLSSESTSKGFAVNAFARKYVLYNNKFGFRVGTYIGYGNSKMKDVTTSGFTTTQQPDGTDNSYSASAKFDLVYYPSNKIGLAATLANANYTRVKQKTGDDRNLSIENWGVSTLSNGITLSVFYVLGAK